VKKKYTNVFYKYLDIFAKIPGWFFPVIASISIFILLATFSFSLNRGFGEYTTNLGNFYDHPYSVRNALHEIQLDIFELEYIWSGHSEINYTEPELEELASEMFARIDSSYLVIQKYYLGPSEDVEDELKSYNEFKRYIEKAGYSENRVDHSDSAHFAMNLLLTDVLRNFKIIELFAENKANEFLDLGKSREIILFDTLNELYTATLIFFLISSILAGLLVVAKNTNIKIERKKFRESIKLAPIPIMIHKNGKIIDLSDEWIRLTGYTINDIPTIEEWSRKAYGEKSVPSKEFIMDLYNLETNQDDGVWNVNTSTNDTLIWQFYSGPLGNKTIISTAIDITEDTRRREKIEELHKQTYKLAQAVDQSPVSIVITDKKGNIEYVNKYFTTITGYSFEEALGENPRILKSGIQDKIFYKNLWDTISSGEIWEGNLQNRTKGGEIYWESASISPILDDAGTIISYVAVKENITERIQAEQSLIETHKKLLNAQKIGNIGNWFFDSVTEKIDWSDQLFEIYNRDIDLGPPTLEEFQSYHLDNEESFSKLLKALEKGVAYDEDITLITRQGQKKYIRTVGVPEYNSEGTLLRFTGVAQDITYSKTIELDLIESEQRLKGITDNIEGLVQRYVQYEDGSNAITYISKGVERLHGVTQKQVIEDSSVLWDQIFEEDVDKVFKSVQKSAKELSAWDCRWRVKTPDQSLKWVHGKGFPHKDQENKCIIWDSIVVDVTKEVVSERSLKETNIRLNAAQDIARIGYFSVDIASNEVYLSPIVREIHEMDKNVSVNEGINYYKEGYDKERIAFVVKEAIEKGIPYKEELRIITAKGNEKWVRTNGRPVMEGGKCVQLIGTFIDITEEKEKEQKLIENLEEKEILLAEIHHRVKNNLAVISGMLELQAFSSTNSKEVEELAKSVNRIKSIAIIHEQLYKAGNFAAISIDESIISQINSLVKMYDPKIEGELKLSFDLEKVSLNVNQAIPFGLLINELVTNTLKYAFKGVPNPELRISLNKVNQDVEFSILDNGVGFNVDKFKNAKDSLGHSLIEAFVAQLEGNLDIQSSSEKGTHITITFNPSSKKGASANISLKS